MSVLLPNAQLRARAHAHPFERDEHGMPVTPTAPPPWRGPWAGAVHERAGGGEAVGEDPKWDLRLPIAVLPLAERDAVADADGDRRWAVVGVEVIQVPGHPDVDYVAVVGVLDPPKRP